MGLLAPLFLIGACAIALPLWLHRLQTKSSNRQAFSSAMLLETTEQQVHVEKKLKYLLLLALRIAFLLLLAAAFAKPFLERPPQAAAAAGAGTRIVVLDASASMGRSGAFAQARNTATGLIDAAPDGAAVQAVVADGRTRVAAPATLERGEHRRLLADSRAGAEYLPYAALVEQVERLAEDAPRPVSVHLVSDFQASATPPRFADLIAAGVADFVPHVVGTGSPVNWWIESVQTSPSTIDVVVTSAGEFDRAADVELTIGGARVDTQSVAGSGRHSIRFADLELAQGEHEITITLSADDDLATDNRWHGVIAIEPPAPVPIVTANRGGLPMTYLDAALGAIVGSNYEVLPLVIGDFDPRVLTRYRWAIVDDLGDVDPTLAERLEEYLAGGGNLLAFTGDATRGMDTLPVSGHATAAAALGRPDERFASVAQLDLRHPALAATDGWHRLRVSETTPVDLGDDDEVLIGLDNGLPLLIERTLGEGRMLLMLSALDNRWNDLPVHPVFVGFVFEAARYMTGRVAAKRQYLAGETLPLSMIGSASGQVVDPDGETVLSLADTASAQLIRLSKPGFYAVYTALGETRVAVNVDPRESDLARMPQTALDRWQDLSVDEGGGEAARVVEDTANPLALWPWLLLFLAVIVIAESALGNFHVATTKRASA